MTSLTTETFLDALYRGLLGREGDPQGMRDWADHLANGVVTPTEVVKNFLESDEYHEKARTNQKPERFTNDVSQYGETFELLKLWVAENQTCGWVVDVGARGRERSNSYDLIKYFGWHGLLIEANPQLIPTIQDDFKGLSAEIVNCAVSDYEGTATLSLGVNDDISSLTEANTKVWGELRGSIEVNVRKLEDILDEQQTPSEFDLLSLDIEGEDIKVLNSLIINSSYRPRWIIIEASHNFTVRSLDDLDFSDKVKTLYEIRGQTVANLILGLKQPPTAQSPA